MTTENKDLMKYVAGDAIEILKEAKPKLDNFLKETSRKPKPNNIKKNKFANNADYLEIGYIEAQLDRIFHGLWKWQITNVQHIINGVQVTGDLDYFHPIASVWISRSGVAFKEFQLESGATEPNPENLSKKALERDVPIAAAECFKNAAKKVGNAFGRNLNRSFDFDHIPDEDIMNRIMNDD